MKIIAKLMRRPLSFEVPPKDWYAQMDWLSDAAVLTQQRPHRHIVPVESSTSPPCAATLANAHAVTGELSMGRKLYVGNLGFDVTNQELQDEFG